MDKQYGDCDLTRDGGVPFEVALGVDARVVRANHSGLVTIDAGLKSLTTDGGVALDTRRAPDRAPLALMRHAKADMVPPALSRTPGPGNPTTLTNPEQSGV